MERVNYEKALIESLVTRREAMIIANKCREMNEESPIYLQYDFLKIADELDEMARML